MPLTDLVRNLNSRSQPSISGLHSTTPFSAADGRVFVHYANLRLESRFLPFVETRTGKVCGHTAVLSTIGLSNRQPLEPGAIFALPTDDEEFVYLDRLIRTLHALNYLTHQVRGNLLLKVHPRHVASVPAEHGLAFEEILRPCGLVPEQITLEIDPLGIDDQEHLKRAVTNYQSRGYGIAIGGFGRSVIDFGLLQHLRPDIVKLDPLLLASGRPLHRLIDCLHVLSAQVMIDGVDTAALRKGAATAHIDLLQAHAPLRRLLHAMPDASNTPTATEARRSVA